MSDNQNPDALVVGAGPTGLAMATDLIRQGLKVRIIDLAEKASNLSKATTIMPRTLEEFQIRGLHERVVELGKVMHGFSAFYKGLIVFKADYARISSDFNYLVNIPQCDVELVLREELDRLGGEIEWGVTLKEFEDHGDHVKAEIVDSSGNTENLDVSWLLGCDGAHSTVRKGLDLKFHGNAYQDTWLLADLSIDWKFTSDSSYSFFCEDGVLAIFPMPEGRHRIYILQTLEYQLNRDPEFSDIVEAVERIAPGICKLSDPDWMAEFHCHHRKVKHYRKKEGRVFIGGDAAHIHSPETGLGLNTGVQDSFNLAWKIASVHQGRSPESLLDTYDLERSFVGEQVVKLSDTTHKMTAQFGLMGNLTRSAMWRIFSNHLKTNFETFEAGLGLRIQYKGNDYVINHGKVDKFRLKTLPEAIAGVRSLEAKLLPPQATPDQKEYVRLYDRINPLRHTLMVMTGPDNSEQTVSYIRELIEFTEPVRDQLDILIITGMQTDEGFEEFSPNVFLDPTHHFHHHYGAETGAVFVIRPDSYIGLSSRPIDSKRPIKYLKQLFTKLDA